MLYAVILDVDTNEDTTPNEVVPSITPNITYNPVDIGEDAGYELALGEWVKTENDKQYEVPDRFADDANGEDLHGWKNGHHAKWCATLTEDQFLELVEELGVHYDGDGSSLTLEGMMNAMVYVHSDESSDIHLNVTPHCPENEIADWLREHSEHVPDVLRDSRGQKHLFRGTKDKREPWAAVTKAVREMTF